MAKRKMMKKTKPIREKKSNSARKKVPGTRFNVDDPVNDIHDDDLYDEETGLQKEVIDTENYERPW